MTESRRSNGNDLFLLLLFLRLLRLLLLGDSMTAALSSLIPVMMISPELSCQEMQLARQQLSQHPCPADNGLYSVYRLRAPRDARSGIQVLHVGLEVFLFHGLPGMLCEICFTPLAWGIACILTLPPAVQQGMRTASDGL